MELITGFFTNPLYQQFAGWLLTAGLAFIAVVHFYWTVGGKRGLAAAIPVENGVPIFLPSPGATFIIGFVALLSAMIIPGKLGYYSETTPAFLFDWTPWVLAVIFLLRSIGDFRYMGLFRRVGQSRFATWDNRFYTPFSLLMCLCACMVAAA